MATLNPGIILQGAQPNILAAMDAGQQAGARQNAIQQQNALSQAYKTDGAGILSGNTESLNRLAAIDAPLAMNFRQSQQGMQIDAQNAQLRAAELARTLDADTRSRAAEQFGMGANMIATAQTPEQFQTIITRPGFAESAGILGITPDMLTFENRDTLAAAALGAADVLKMRAGPEPTTSQRDYQFYAQQERQAGRQPLSFNEWDTQGKKASANQVNVNTGEGDKFYEELDKGQAGMFQTLMDEGVQAGRTMQQIDRLGEILSTTPTGAGAAFKTLLGEYGIATDGLDDLQAAQALINQLVPQQRQPGSGPMSDADLALFKQSVPRLINQPGGNQIIIERMRGIAQYQMQQAEIASAVADRKLTPAQGREALANLANPLAGFADQMDGGGQQQGGGNRTSSGVSWSIEE